MVLAAACTAGTVFAQKPCGTDEHYHQLLKEHPELVELEQQFNEQVGRGLAAKGTAGGPDTAYYDLPLVIHVVHDYGFSTEFLSDNAIYEAVQNWALAFVKKNADTSLVIPPFIPYIGNARIRLHLATKDPNGNPTKGVIRHYSYLTNNGSDQSKFTPWPNNKYMNIWFTKTLGTSGAAAYAYYPSSAAGMPHYDGVIGLAEYLNYSKTIPHEIGHCLNLQHVWGNTNNPAVACGNDQVDDTPPTKGHNPGCVASAIYDTACATGYAKTYVSMSGMMDSVVNYPDTVNAQNIMDYTYCANMFSMGQCVRMRNALTSTVAGRNNLITPSNLVATGALEPMPDLPPVAEFCVNKGTGGTTSDPRSYFLTTDNVIDFSFRNMSWNDTISSVKWDFSNGAATPTSTATGNVTNSFTVPGWVTVTLTATSNAGSNTLVKEKAVYAADPNPVGGLGYSQSFGSESAISNWPMINVYENNFKWEFYNGAGKDDNSCVRFRSYDGSDRRTGTATGDYDDFVTPAFDLAGLSGDLYFNFFTTGASTSPGGWVTKVYDSLQIDVSTSGGARWQKIGAYRTTDLANNGSIGGEFIPGSSSTWVPRSVTIPATYRTSQTFFRFRLRAGNGGNNVYLDNVGIGLFPAEVQEAAATSNNSLYIYPNPSSNGCNLVFKAGDDNRMKYCVRDVTGKVILEAERAVTPNSLNTEFISRSAVGTPGMYIVTVTSGSSISTQKMVVY
ncbi:hypothetical protein GCM10023093_06970 [Nemorincola caseinilytica]|uniref:PKD domain-containing protein n=2 Tax=Nemorincola caseinilytica TaxID=2054315 RepID=A0ABP8N9G7_9BACT